MAIRFWIELSVGIITLVAILIFGKAGTPVFALLALSPIIYRLKKIKPDERETQLFFKGTQYIVNIIVVIILLSVFVFNVKLIDLTAINGTTLLSIAASFIIIGSALRLYLYYKH